MKYTKNYNFKKPEPYDTRNINDINDSFDLVDAKLKETQDKNVNLDETFKQLIIDKGNSNAEIVASRRDKINNKTHNSLPDRLDSVSSQLAQTANEKADKSELEKERQRITNLAKLTEGSTTGDAELIDARVGADGIIYDNTGTAIRTQISDLFQSEVTNVLDSKAILPGKYMNGFYNNTGYTSNSLNNSKSFNVSDGQIIYITFTKTQYYNYYTFLDAGNVILSYKRASDNGSITDYAVRVPKGAAKLVVSGDVSNITNLVVKVAKPKVYTLQTETELSRTGEYGYYANGVWKSTSYIGSLKYDVSNGIEKINISITPTQYYDIYTFVKDDGTVLGYKRAENTGYVQTDITVPNGAKYLYVSGLNAALNSLLITFFQNAIDNINDNFQTITTLKSSGEYGFYNNGVWNVTGYVGALKYDVNDGIKKVKISLTTTQYMDIYTFVKDDGTVLLYKRAETVGSHLVEVEVPSGSKYLYISGNSASLQSLNVTFFQYVFNSIGNRIAKREPYVKGKKILWLGTSIPAGGYFGFNSYKSYPKSVGELLNCSVQNNAVGSSVVHCRKQSLVSTNNPYGFISDFEAASRCLTNTIEMMNWIITNWNNVEVFTSRVPASMTEELKQNIKNCSYEKLIVPYFTTDMPDIWVFDHGHNDNMTDVESGYNNGIFSFKDGMNYLINLIKQNNPKSRIVIIGEYENQLRPAIAENQLALAQKWLIPIYKQWEVLGWTQNKIITTGQWIDGIWYNNSTNAHEMTELEIALPDKIHPHTDLSYKTLDYMAYHIAKWLEKYCAW